MIPDIKKLLTYLKVKGYTSNKDVLGIYFNKGDRRFSAMKQGNWYTCFHNVNKDSQWVLVSKSQMFNSYNEALYWVYQEIEKLPVGH